jgi:VWFA-related protein
MLSFPNSGTKFSSATTIDAIQAARMDFDIFTINSHDRSRTPLASPSGSMSKLDLKAPGKAQREYQKGYQLLMRRDFAGAIQHLQVAIQIYPRFVAAHDALGTAYLDLNQNEGAREEFSKAVALDDHLPNSYLDLGIAQLALRQYVGAEESFRKASSLAPLDLQLAVALAYGEFANQDYPAVLATAAEVHSRPHKGAELVHYFAAGAWGAQGNLVEAQHQMEVLLQEDPSAASADQFRHILTQIKNEQAIKEAGKLRERQAMSTTSEPPKAPSSRDRSQVEGALQDTEEKEQIAEAESAAEFACMSCGPAVVNELNKAQSSGARVKRAGSGYVLRSSVDEVDVFFSATDHGSSVTNLTAADIQIRDGGRPPDRITGFRNESQLPLRLGLVLDTSDSVKHRLVFEEKAATKFLESVLTNERDLAFAVGVNNSVLLVQDFTPQLGLISRAINQLAPGGGTALWDAVAFAAGKLANRAEVEPVARVLVLISDGQDNSSHISLKEAIAQALRGETVIYTVSTKDLLDEDSRSLLGDCALATLSELTGGASFVPGSLRRLEGSLKDVQHVIRGRYLLTYSPGSFQYDGSYRRIELTAARSGRRFKVFARKGYYASPAHAEPRTSAGTVDSR